MGDSNICAMTADEVRAAMQDLNVFNSSAARDKLIAFLAQRELERMEREPARYEPLKEPVTVDKWCSKCGIALKVCCFSRAALNGPTTCLECRDLEDHANTVATVNAFKNSGVKFERDLENGAEVVEGVNQ